jgi:hypothetical protein
MRLAAPPISFARSPSDSRSGSRNASLSHAHRFSRDSALEGDGFEPIGPCREEVGFRCGTRIARMEGGSPQRGVSFTGYRWFESISLQQTVRISPRPGRCRSKNPRFRAGVRRCGRQRHPVLVEIAQTGAVISVRRYFSTAVPVMSSGNDGRAELKLPLGSISQAKPSRARCSCQASGRREWASSLSAVRWGGCPPSRMACVMSGAR